MKRTEIIKHIRDHRRDLVLAAEARIKGPFEGGWGDMLPAKTQFSRLVNVCGEASCAEEIANYLRYQAGRAGRDSRGKGNWKREFVDAVLAGIEGVFERMFPDGALEPRDRDLVKVEAWRLYATYLTRAFTYHKAASEPRDRRENGHHEQRSNRRGR